ncbi:proline iminopeptidase [Prauserella shujinwangii]|uniref:Proline iminopeptidase n=1 Tax=Prauserella shujinwangii TaxID=1453103 RepID=A0A2T0M1D8_9PSEU|nr:prolyl aminopeptidase [Prauserella shujinwangii]PRX50370.1 proline iminopeptidase [Prauserella shujinwangii]
MDVLYPPIEPYDHGLLDVGEGNHVYWEVSGNPRGKPALIVHGGPGAPNWLAAPRYFDPARYRIVHFHQRGCGRSTPHAGDHRTGLAANTTHHLLADMERLRTHLGIERWLLIGGSWGSTLALAYAERHPERVTELVLVAVTSTRRSEIDWLYRGAGRFFPAEWDRFRAGVPEADRDGDLVAAYARLIEDPDPAVRERAILNWCAWEDAVVSLEENAPATAMSSLPPAERTALVRICAHYFAHGAWLAEDQLIREAHRLAGIPGVLVHGRLDLGAPLRTAWELSRAWPDAELVVIGDSGHKGNDAMRARLRRTMDEFAANGEENVAPRG